MEMKLRVWFSGVKKLVCFDAPIIGIDCEEKWGVHFKATEGTVFMDKNETEFCFGQKDTKDKDIFAGDIIKIAANPNHGVGVVRFGEYQLKPFTKHDRQKKHFGLYVEFNGKQLSLIDCLETPKGFGSSTHSVEVIGNIHENPELLK